MILGVSFACILGLFCLYIGSLLTLVRHVREGHAVDPHFVLFAALAAGVYRPGSIQTLAVGDVHCPQGDAPFYFRILILFSDTHLSFGPGIRLLL